MSEIPKRKKRHAQAPGAKLHNDKLHAVAQERRGQALQLRLRGMSVSEIARQLDVDTKTAHNYVKAALAAIPHETAKDEIAIAIASRDAQKVGEVKRALSIERKLANEVLKPQEYARLQTALTGVRALILSIDQDLAKLKGQYAPQQHAVAFERVNPATVREMTNEQLQQIATCDFSPLNGAGGGAGGRDRGAGDPPPRGAA